MGPLGVRILLFFSLTPKGSDLQRWTELTCERYQSNRVFLAYQKKKKKATHIDTLYTIYVYIQYTLFLSQSILLFLSFTWRLIYLLPQQ